MSGTAVALLPGGPVRTARFGGPMRSALAVNTDMQANDRDAVIRAHIGLARSLALRLAGKVPASVDLDDLIGAGVLGLIDAVDRFDPSRAIPFEAYARTRIQGAILDAMRAEDHLSRR